MENNKAADNDWFRLESNKDGTRWFGKGWYIQDLLKYEFEIEFDVSDKWFSSFLGFFISFQFGISWGISRETVLELANLIDTTHLKPVTDETNITIKLYVLSVHFV